MSARVDINGWVLVNPEGRALAHTFRPGSLAATMVLLDEMGVPVEASAHRWAGLVEDGWACVRAMAFIYPQVP